MNGQYILDENGEPKPVKDILEWGKWMQTGDRIVKVDKLPNDVTVSTVFLGLDHNYFGSGEPVLWETMIFGGPHDQYQYRYTSREEALAGHEKALALAKEEENG